MPKDPFWRTVAAVVVGIVLFYVIATVVKSESECMQTGTEQDCGAPEAPDNF